MPATVSALRHASPESVGLSSKNILDFVEAIEAADHELHSFVVLKNRHVVAEGWWEPYRRDDIHLLYSLSKSFTSTAIGFTVQEGLVQLDDPVISFFPSQMPDNPSDKLQAMKVRHLLSMSTGHDVDNMSDMYGREDKDWVCGFLARDVVHEPGTHFLYNNGASYMLSAIVTRVTGMSALDYLRPRLFDPIGIEQATWTACPNGVSVGASELRITTESIARFGQFYLQRGVWEGERLLSEAWVEDASRFQVSNATNDQPDWQQGYGFQFWRCRHNCYRGDGAFGQFCIVVDELQMVIAITASVSSMQGVLDLVWQHLYEPAKVASIEEQPDWHLALKAKCASLTLPGPGGKPSSQFAREVTGRMYKATSSESPILTTTFDFYPQGCLLTVRTPMGDKSLRIGSDEWIRSIWSAGADPTAKVAAIGRWITPHNYEIKVRYTESPSGANILCHFSGNAVKMQTTLTGRFGTPEVQVFEGTASYRPL